MDASTTRAAQAPDGNAQPQKGTYQIIYVGPCWGRVHNPHNSSGQRQGPQYVQAKTDMHCNETLGEIGGTLTVRNKLYVKNEETGNWAHMQTNVSVCPAGSATNGWTQCHPANYNYHPVMIAGVNDFCEIGSTRDYLQTSSARLVDGAGRVFVGVSSKIGRNVLCRG